MIRDNQRLHPSGDQVHRQINVSSRRWVNRTVRQEENGRCMIAYDRFATITREAFADFLDRYANHETNEAEWEHFVIQHYGDSFLEEIRRCVVRLVINKLPIHGASGSNGATHRSPPPTTSSTSNMFRWSRRQSQLTVDRNGEGGDPYFLLCG